MNEFPSWGLYPEAKNQTLLPVTNRFAEMPSIRSTALPRGLGRSYGDSCLNNDGELLGTLGLQKFISFDQDQGLLRCEAGVSFDEILKLVVPKGWFLPVTPGTKFVTVGGAIANDVHGKNHHMAGNFGRHVTRFELLRSTGERLECSRDLHPELFHATVGGLGLTGLITWAEFKLSKIESSYIEQEQIQFRSLNEFFALAAESEKSHEFTVAWVDCVSDTKNIHGIFIRGNWAQAPASVPEADRLKLHASKSLKSVPFFFPEWILNKFSIRAFNELYFRKNLSARKINTVHYDPFFYPLDSLHNWNRIYGKRGFLQYQFVVPYKNDQGRALQEIFQLLSQSQMGSFLAVLKTFGAGPSDGLMSFPQEGVTLALDFANYGEPLLRILEECDQIVRRAGGAVYPAKDARLSKENFAAFFPRKSVFEKYLDPLFSSSFWRRVR